MSQQAEQNTTVPPFEGAVKDHPGDITGQGGLDRAIGPIRKAENLKPVWSLGLKIHL